MAGSVDKNSVNTSQTLIHQIQSLKDEILIENQLPSLTDQIENSRHLQQSSQSQSRLQSSIDNVGPNGAYINKLKKSFLQNTSNSLSNLTKNNLYQNINPNTNNTGESNLGNPNNANINEYEPATMIE